MYTIRTYSVVHMYISVQRIIYMCTTNVSLGLCSRDTFVCPRATGRAILGAGGMVGSGSEGGGETSCCGDMGGPGGGGGTPDTREGGGGTVSPRPALAGGGMGFFPGGMGATGGAGGICTAAEVRLGVMVGGPGTGTATCVGPPGIVGG